MTYYFRKLQIELQGGPKINKRDETKTLMRQRMKIGVNENWFTQRRGGVRESICKENEWRLRKHNKNSDDQQTKIKPVYKPGQRFTRRPPKTTTGNNRIIETTNKTRQIETTPVHMLTEATLLIAHMKNF